VRKGQAYRDRHPLAVAAVELSGIRTFVAVPLLKESEAVGVMTIYRRDEFRESSRDRDRERPVYDTGPGIAAADQAKIFEE
jgi:hypothetical protein